MTSLLDKARSWVAGETDGTEKAMPFFNPLGLNIGGSVKVNSVDFSQYDFAVREILDYDYGGSERQAGYVLRARSGGHDDVVIRLRVFKEDNRVRVITCTLHDELDEEPGIIGAVNDRGGIFVITRHDLNDAREEFRRLADARISRPAKIARRADNNGDGLVRQDEISWWESECWEYSRMTTMDGVPVKEYLFVEATKERVAQSKVRRFRLWRGVEVPASQVVLD